ncbi:MAG: hypothetical protein IPM27_10140 [Nitrosomonadales bacterium]|nr:hypothetical protein [Nitrosomonadales bacterium]
MDKEFVAVNRGERLKSLTRTGYILYALTIFTGITCFIAIIINYVNKSAVVGTWLESHFSWQIRTFWVGLLGNVIGVPLTAEIGAAMRSEVIYAGLVMAWYIALATWLAYRVLKGWRNLNDSKPMPI